MPAESQLLINQAGYAVHLPVHAVVRSPARLALKDSKGHILKEIHPSLRFDEALRKVRRRDAHLHRGI